MTSNLAQSRPMRPDRAGRPVRRVAGIAEMIISESAADVLVTYSLGSCVGLTLFDPDAVVGALIHCMLPLAKIQPEEAAVSPYKFTDTGVAAVIQEMFNHGAQRSRIIAKVAGAAAPIDDKGFFKIGERNYTVLRKVLWKNNILIAAEDIRGTKPRTMTLHMDSGRTMIRSRGKEIEPRYREPSLARMRPGARSPDLDSRPSTPQDAAFAAGDHVRHQRFGEGVVVSCVVTSADQEVTVAFGNGAGVKKLLLSYAPLEKV